MHRLTNRCQQILKLLINNKLLNLSKLEMEINVSKKTLIKDLDCLEIYLKEFNVELSRIPNKGIQIIGEKSDISKLETQLNKSNINVLKPIDNYDRQVYIIVRLLDSKEPVSIQTLSDELFVSRGTITNELPAIKNILQEYDCTIEKKQNKGLIIVAKEENIRKVYSKMMLKLKRNAYLINLINEIKIQHKTESFEHLADEKIFDVIDKNIIKKLSIILVELENDLGYSFTDEAFVTIMIHIIIATKRIKEGSEVELEDSILLKLKSFDEYDIIKKNLLPIEEIFDISLTDSEIGYVSLHVLGAKVFKTINLTQEDDIFSTSKELENIINQMIKIIEKNLKIKVINKDEFFKSLAIHIRPAINRLQNNMPIKNPYLEEVKRNYFLSFAVATECFNILIDKYGFKMNEHEIAYITLHIEAEMEMLKCLNKNKLKVIVLCSSGLGTSRLLAAKIRNEFSNIEIIDTLSIINISKCERINEVDLIISTVPFYSNDIPTIVTNTFLTESDIEKINSKIKDIKRNNKLIKNESLDIFKEDMVLIDLKGDKNQVLKTMCDYLVDKNIVKPTYYKTVIDREEISSTSHERFAIPHGDINEIDTPFILVGILKQPIVWDNNSNVQIVFLLGMNNTMQSSIDNIFDRLYTIFSDKEKINNIISSNDTAQIIRLIID